MIHYDGEGRIVVEGVPYENPTHAYLAFRKLYNKSLGRATKRRIDTLTARRSVISHYGIDFVKEYAERLNEEFKDTKKADCYVLGLIGISYCYVYSESGFDPAFRDYDDDKRERYLDWLMCAGTSGVRFCGRMDTLDIKVIYGTPYGRYVRSKKLKLRDKWKKTNTTNNPRS